MTRDAKAEARAINQILWRDWDPIGGGAPQDEYQSHVWPVYKLLIDGASREHIVKYLAWAADEQLKCPAPDSRLQRTADKLIALRLGKGLRLGKEKENP